MTHKAYDLIQYTIHDLRYDLLDETKMKITYFQNKTVAHIKLAMFKTSSVYKLIKKYNRSVTVSLILKKMNFNQIKMSNNKTKQP